MANRNSSLRWLIPALLVLGAIGAYWWLHQPAPTTRTAAAAGVPSATAAVSAHQPLAVTSPPAGSAASPPPLDMSDPNIQAWQAQQDFKNRITAFFNEAKTFPAVRRRSEAAELTEQVKTYESEKRLTAAEAMMLRVELIRASVDDEQEQTRQIQTLNDQYRQAYDQSQAQATSDPRMQDYKQREREIVQRVMGMTQFPDGMDRDAYLRQQLQQARVQVFSQSSP